MENETAVKQCKVCRQDKELKCFTITAFETLVGICKVCRYEKTKRTQAQANLRKRPLIYQECTACKHVHLISRACIPCRRRNPLPNTKKRKKNYEKKKELDMVLA